MLAAGAIAPLVGLGLADRVTSPPGLLSIFAPS